MQLLAAADATDDALAAAAAADAARRTKSRDAARAAQRQAELEGLASTSADAAAAARALLASGSAATAAGARHGAGHAGVLRVAGTWRRDGTSAAVAAPVDMVPPEVFAEARRVAQRDALVTVRHVVPLASPLQEAVEAGDGAPLRPPEQQPAKLLLFLVHSRLPRVAAITAVQCDAALLSPEHHQVDPSPTPSPSPSPNLDPNPNPNPGTTRSYSSCSWWAPRRSPRWRAHGPERCSGGTAETHDERGWSSCRYLHVGCFSPAHAITTSLRRFPSSAKSDRDDARRARLEG